jgi:hypothetical protein
MYQKPNKCKEFLEPQPHKYKNVETDDELNIGIMNASRKLFELGVKYTKDMFVTITTAEATILVEASLKTMEHFIDKLNENPQVSEIINNQMPKLLGLFDSGENILRYIGYYYFTKSYNNYASANKPYINDNVILQDDIGFKKMLELASNPNNMKKQHGNDDEQIRDQNAIKIVDEFINKILLLPPDEQQDALLKITDEIKRKLDKRGEVKRDDVKNGVVKKYGGKSKKKCRIIKKMIKRTMRKFCNTYPRITK